MSLYTCPYICQYTSTKTALDGAPTLITQHQGRPIHAPTCQCRVVDGQGSTIRRRRAWFLSQCKSAHTHADMHACIHVKWHVYRHARCLFAVLSTPFAFFFNAAVVSRASCFAARFAAAASSGGGRLHDETNQMNHRGDAMAEATYNANSGVVALRTIPSGSGAAALARARVFSKAPELRRLSKPRAARKTQPTVCRCCPDTHRTSIADSGH